MKYPKWQLLFLALSVFALSNCNTVETTEDQSANSELSEEAIEEIASIKKLMINAPSEQLEVPVQSFTINTQKGEVLSMKNGSSIEIPANTFVDENGIAVKGKVEIEYREFHTPAQIISSGIPMKVLTDDGAEEWMQTAGMFEIQGFAKGKAVFIAEGKAVQVNMVSFVDGEYDFWHFDETIGNWNNLGTTQASKNPNKLALNGQDVASPTQSIEPPKKPVALNKKNALNFELDYSDFPNVKDKKGLVWQYSGKEDKDAPSKNEWIYNEEWTDIELDQTDDGVYQVTLTSDEKMYAIPVVPVLNKNDYAAAMKAYQQQFAAYEEAAKNMDQYKIAAIQQADFLRTYQVQNFGVFNYDILYKNPNRVQFAADFKFANFEDDREFRQRMQVYLVTADNRAIVPFDNQTRKSFSVNPDANNKLIAILPGNQVAIFSEKEFKKQLSDIMAAHRGEYTFKMSVQDQVIASVEDLDNVIL